MCEGLYWILNRYKQRRSKTGIYKPAFDEPFPSEKCSQCNRSGSSSAICKQGSPQEFCKNKVFCSRLQFLPENKNYLSAWNQSKALQILLHTPPPPPPLFFLCVDLQKKSDRLPNPFTTPFSPAPCSGSCLFWEHKHYLFWGRLPAIVTSSEEMLPRISRAGKIR